MNLDPHKRPDSRSSRRHEINEIEWTAYPRIPPGEYPAYCQFARTYRDPAFNRWTCLLQWSVLKPDSVGVIARLPMWLALGSGEKPRASRRGSYAKEWVNAHGGPPMRGDRLSPRVFTRRLAQVLVGDTTKGPMPYSVVTKIVRWETGISVTQSASHTIKDGNGETQ